MEDKFEAIDEEAVLQEEEQYWQDVLEELTLTQTQDEDTN